MPLSMAQALLSPSSQPVPLAAQGPISPQAGAEGKDEAMPAVECHGSCLPQSQRPRNVSHPDPKKESAVTAKTGGFLLV